MCCSCMELFGLDLSPIRSTRGVHDLIMYRRARGRELCRVVCMCVADFCSFFVNVTSETYNIHAGAMYLFPKSTF